MFGKPRRIRTMYQLCAYLKKHSLTMATIEVKATKRNIDIFAGHSINELELAVFYTVRSGRKSVEFIEPLARVLSFQMSLTGNRSVSALGNVLTADARVHELQQLYPKAKVMLMHGQGGKLTDELHAQLHADAVGYKVSPITTSRHR